jgi:hypothetical protein
MPSVACGSHWYVYVPTANVTVHVTVPVKGTVVSSFTFVPKRWKLCWSDDRSLTITSYVPAAMSVSATPFASVIAIVESGPTVARRIGFWANALPGAANAARASAMTRLRSTEAGSFRR